MYFIHDHSLHNTPLSRRRPTMAQRKKKEQQRGFLVTA